jgi:histidyl-tRNA synthetase
MKSQLKAADRSGAPLALLIGSEELAQKSVTIRALRETREQTAVSVEELLDAIEDTGEITW